MKKYNVTVYATSNEILLQCVMDQFSLNDFLHFENENFIKIEDDALDVTYMFNIAQIVCIEYKEIRETS
jgi:hypothetical protein